MKGAVYGAHALKKGSLRSPLEHHLWTRSETSSQPCRPNSAVSQEHEIRPWVGSPIQIDIRIIAATRQTWSALVKSGKFGKTSSIG